MPARDDEPDEALGKRRRRAAVGGEPGGVEVTFEVVDGEKRQAARPGEGASERQPDEERADEPRPRGRGDRADVVDRHPGARQGLCVDRRPVGELLARGELRHDAAIGPVHRELGGDHRGEHPPRAVDHRAGGVVTAGFDAEDERRPHAASLPAPAPRRRRARVEGGIPACDRLLLASRLPPADRRRPTPMRTRQASSLARSRSCARSRDRPQPSRPPSRPPRTAGLTASMRRSSPTELARGTARAGSHPALRRRHGGGVYPCSNVDLIEFLPALRHGRARRQDEQTSGAGRTR